MMNAKEMAKRFPEAYRSEVQEMIENRIETNRLREQAGLEIRMPIEQYTNKVLITGYGLDAEMPTMTLRQQSRMRMVNEALDASRRVLRNAQKGEF